jgi:hypothetical protein
LFTRNDLAFGDASFCFGNAKHSVAVPGSIIRPDAEEGKCPSAYFEVLELGIQTVFFCSPAIDEWRRRGDLNPRLRGSLILRGRLRSSPLLVGVSRLAV